VKFLAESVWDLKESLERASSGLVIRVGLLADVVKGALEYLKGKKVRVYGVWMTGGVIPEELQEERDVKVAVKEHGIDFCLFPDEKYLVN